VGDDVGDPGEAGVVELGEDSPFSEQPGEEVTLTVCV
jgi:hypothetical protein